MKSLQHCECGGKIFKILSYQQVERAATNSRWSFSCVWDLNKVRSLVKQFISKSGTIKYRVMHDDTILSPGLDLSQHHKLLWCHCVSKCLRLNETHLRYVSKQRRWCYLLSTFEGILIFTDVSLSCRVDLILLVRNPSRPQWLEL